MQQPPVPPGHNASLVEFDFVTGLLADPSRVHDVEDIKPVMLQDDNLRVIYGLLHERNGRVTQATLHDDLMKLPAGQKALAEIAADIGLPNDHRAALDHLFRQGVMSGDVEILADVIRNEAVKRWVYRAVTDIKPDRFADASEFASTLASQISNIASKAAPSVNRDALVEGADEELAHWKSSQSNPHKVMGARVNLGEFDELMGGLKPGELTLIGGHSGEGKTQIMCHMALEAAMTPYDETGERPVVAYFSIEMSRRQIASRWMSKLANVSLLEKYVTPEQERRIVEANAQLKQLGRDRKLILIEPHTAYTLEQICRSMAQIKDQDGLDIAFIDYAQLVRATNSSESRYDQLAQVAQRLKNEAFKHNIAIVMGVQLNREALTNSGAAEPKMHHIADSLDLARSADNIHMIWTPARHITGENKGAWLGIAVLLTEKRRNGPVLPRLYYAYYPDRTTLVPVNAATKAELASPEQQAILRNSGPQVKKSRPGTDGK